VGKNAEAAGAASLKGAAGVFSNSKTKGFFAGVSLEGSTIIERRDANEKLYGQRYTAAELLAGRVRPPPAASSLMNIFNSRVFSGISGADDPMYNDIPLYNDKHNDVVWEGRRGISYGKGQPKIGDGFYGRKRASIWADDVYDRQPNSGVTKKQHGSKPPRKRLR
jgi:SH3 domain-containing YSC84-like protein 1